jgi:hypothetical protein
MVTDCVVATGKVVTPKTLVFQPEVTVTLAGTVAAVVLLLERVTTAPAAGAGSVSGPRTASCPRAGGLACDARHFAAAVATCRLSSTLSISRLTLWEGSLSERVAQS